MRPALPFLTFDFLFKQIVSVLRLHDWRTLRAPNLSASLSASTSMTSVSDATRIRHLYRKADTAEISSRMGRILNLVGTKRKTLRTSSLNPIQIHVELLKPILHHPYCIIVATDIIVDILGKAGIDSGKMDSLWSIWGPN
jgi:hypothetical protein